MKVLRSAAIATVLVAAVLGQKPAPGTVVEGDLGVRLDALVREKASGFWGAVLVAVDGKPVLAKGYGAADRTKTPIGPQSLFDLGGASQQLTAVLALQLVAEGKLRLDTTVGSCAPGWPADKAGVVLEHLLRHTSGLPLAAPWSGSSAATSAGALQVIGRTPLVARPGAAVLVCNANAALLGLMAEATLQQKFDKLLVERVCRPTGMSTAGPCNGRFDGKLVTFRRSPTDERGAPATAMALDWSRRGATGVLASVLDVHAFLAALTSGTVLDDALLQELWRPLEGADFGVVHVPADRATLIRVYGKADGYRARWTLHRAEKRWVVLLTEDYGDPSPLETALVALAMAPPEPVAKTTGTAASGDGFAAADRERWVGSYELPRGGGIFRVSAQGDDLWLEGAGLQASARLQFGCWPPVGEERLRNAEDRGLRVLELLLADDAGVDRTGFAEPTEGASARAALAQWKRQHGPIATTKLIGSRLDPPLQPPGSTETWFRVQGKDGSLVLRVAWADASRFRRCEITEEVPPFHVLLRPAGADRVRAETNGGQRLLLTIEGTGNTRSLVFEDESPGAAGLLECPLVVP